MPAPVVVVFPAFSPKNILFSASVPWLFVKICPFAFILKRSRLFVLITKSTLSNVPIKLVAASVESFPKVSQALETFTLDALSNPCQNDPL